MRVRFDRFYTYAELTETLEAWATEHPSRFSYEAIGKSGQPLMMEPSPPLAHGVNVQSQVCGDGGIRPAVSGGQDDVGSDHFAVGSAGGTGARRTKRAGWRW